MNQDKPFEEVLKELRQKTVKYENELPIKSKKELEEFGTCDFYFWWKYPNEFKQEYIFTELKADQRLFHCGMIHSKALLKCPMPHYDQKIYIFVKGEKLDFNELKILWHLPNKDHANAIVMQDYDREIGYGDGTNQGLPYKLAHYIIDYRYGKLHQLADKYNKEPQNKLPADWEFYNQDFNADRLIGNDVNDVTPDRKSWTGDLDWPKHPKSNLYKDIEKEDRY